MKNYRILAIALTLPSLVVACNLIVDDGDFSVDDKAFADSSTGGDSVADSSTEGSVDGSTCVDDAGFGGLGCWKCPPTNRLERLNACTGADCQPFDKRRLPLDGGKLPDLPAADSGVPDTAVADTATTDTGTGDTGTADTGATDTGPDTGPVIPKCSSLPNVVYATGSTAAQLFIGSIAQALENASPPATLVYQTAGSCIGVNAMVAPGTTRMSGNAVYWDPNPAVDPSVDAARLPCKLDDGGVSADVGFSDVFAPSCVPGLIDLDKSLRDYFGPIQTMTMTVPQNSDQKTISAEAAYLVWGFGGTAYPVEPWTDVKYLFQRSATSGTQQMIAATLNVPGDRWFGKLHSGSTGVRDSLIASASAGVEVARKSIGVLGADFADILRDKVRILGFQDYGQTCAFWPDSSAKAFDKRNVRDGHYTIWGPLHMIARVDGSGIPLKTGAGRFLSIVSGAETIKGVSLISTLATRSLVPTCAMRVTRKADGGEISDYKPERSCGCYFEEKATGVSPPPGCKTCATNTECPATAPSCNKFEGQTSGYCEP